jgi:hypothetical protein
VKTTLHLPLHLHILKQWRQLQTTPHSVARKQNEGDRRRSELERGRLQLQLSSTCLSVFFVRLLVVIQHNTMAAATTATANTVSQPLQLSSSDAAAANGTSRRRAVKPSGKVTLTSLTENNVSALLKLGGRPPY